MTIVAPVGRKEAPVVLHKGQIAKNSSIHLMCWPSDAAAGSLQMHCLILNVLCTKVIEEHMFSSHKRKGD